MINYLPQAIINRLELDYLPYDLLLNDWKKELLNWFNIKKFDISNRLLDIFAKESISKYGYLARISFTDVEKGKNRRMLTFQNLTYKEKRNLINLVVAMNNRWRNNNSSDED